jgi:hypothetical protein
MDIDLVKAFEAFRLLPARSRLMEEVLVATGWFGRAIA